ncbi:transglutaminase-like domain-containing protein [Pectinatus brassicae]|uniref:Transglutaminase-like putative cysteine protease n=1 Tax=Pectinatus brassicae TaxID=862415 RepID=A0A840UQL7_9FIRM|nr:transglutaminase domain-containing protein [Pectinatus brassicae]MBB5335293.1 transglutaminase-like putative cysteine protease [Pectinatus brassicae]
MSRNISRILVLYLGVMAILHCLYAYSTLSVHNDEYIFAAAISAILFIVNCQKKQAYIIVFYGLGLLLLAYMFWVHNHEIYVSAVYLVNSFIEIIKQPYHLDWQPFIIAAADKNILYQPAMYALISLTAVCLNLLMIDIKGSAVIILSTLPLCFWGLYLNVMPGLIPLTLLVIFWFSLLSWSGQQSLPVSITALLIVLGTGCLLQYVFPPREYRQPAIIKNIAAAANSYLNDYLSPTGRATSFDDILHGLNGRGKLGDIDTLSQTGQKIMQIETSVPGSADLYLRNYSGAVYVNNSWQHLPDNIYINNQAVFDNYSAGAWYDQSAIIFAALKGDAKGQALLNQYAAAENAGLQRDYKFTIRHIFTNKEQYFFPYDADISSEIFRYDRIYDTNGQKLYQTKIYLPPADYGAVAKFIDAYHAQNKYINYYYQAEKQYRDFVYKYYRQVPAGVLDEFLQVFPVEKVYDEQQKEQLIERLQAYFQKNYQYTLSPGKVPAKHDFVQYFLNESHKGYCTYFASAAVLILRQAGIPARYVVGYAVPVQLIKDGQKIGMDNYSNPLKSIILSDKQAHAWVEIYEDGWGWRPVEFTPSENATARPTKAKVQQAAGKTQQPAKQMAAPAKENIAIDARQSQQYHGKILLLMIILFIGSIAWRKYCQSKIKKLLIIVSDNSNKQILDIYQYVNRLTDYLGIRPLRQMDYTEYMYYLQDKEKRWHNIALPEFINIVLQARFGNGIISRQQLEEALLTVGKMRQIIYADLNIFQKIIFLYIYRL